MPSNSSSGLQFVWLEITGRCQLECLHCYAGSGPTGTHGRLRLSDWVRVIDEVAELGAGMVQFIGGEPTLHPGLPKLIDHALERGVEVEVFTNLVHVTPLLWETFSLPGVRLATSWYSDDPAEHALVTGRPSHARTKAGIAESLSRSIPLRVGIVGIHDDQRVEQARAMLVDLGVSKLGYDDIRHVGRAVRVRPPDSSQLCGRCGDGNLAVNPDGTVWPCVFARWLPIGNVSKASMEQILASPRMRSVTARLRDSFGPKAPCVPDMCEPQCGPSCSPACNPQGNCRPSGACVPWYR